jgi:hypothetical protein
MKIKYILNNKKLQKKLNLQATITDKQLTFYSVNAKTNYKPKLNTI